MQHAVFPANVMYFVCVSWHQATGCQNG